MSTNTQVSETLTIVAKSKNRRSIGVIRELQNLLHPKNMPDQAVKNRIQCKVLEALKYDEVAGAILLYDADLETRTRLKKQQPKQFSFCNPKGRGRKVKKVPEELLKLDPMRIIAIGEKCNRKAYLRRCALQIIAVFSPEVAVELRRWRCMEESQMPERFKKDAA